MLGPIIISYKLTTILEYSQYPVNNTYNIETFTIIEGESHRVEGGIKKAKFM